jgi:Mg-chelatase subunit ChlD
VDEKLQKSKDQIDKKKRRTGGLSGLHVRMQQARAEGPLAPKMENRIGLMVDASGSMNEYHESKSKLDWLKDACEAFINASNLGGDTALMLASFPMKYYVPLTTHDHEMRIGVLGLHTCGMTPMGATMFSVVENEAITRGVLVSDGDATDGDASYDAAERFVEAKIPIDCVHIGVSDQGEERLRRIASMTGGTYMKFRDVSRLVGAFKYLTPAYRAMLADPKVRAELGADEIE